LGLTTSHYNLKKLLLLSRQENKFKMKKIIPIIIALVSLNSCVTLHFPESVNVDITVPVDSDVEKIEIMIDTLKAQAKDYGLTLEALINKKNIKDKKEKKKNK